MSEELKACSWCGVIPIKKDANPPFAEHRCKALKDIVITVPLYAWQSRPLEDALRLKLEKVKGILNKAQIDFDLSGRADIICEALQELEEK